MASLSVCEFLASKGITISSTNEWLKSCVEWFETENSGCNVQQIHEFAYNQLLLADLRVVAHGCLPLSALEPRTTKLLGKYFLQINYVLDVGKSAYSQFQDLRKKSLVNLQVTEEKEEVWKPQPNRMLKMEITDGVRVVYGMEYSTIKKLGTNIVPGTKILVIGPVECRSSVILLEDNNIIVLGGEADSLYDCNHYNRLITRALKLDDQLLPIDNEVPLVTQPLQSSVEPLCNNSLSVLPEHLSATVSVSSSSTYTSRNNIETVYQPPQGANDDYFTDSDIFLNVPVDDINIAEGGCSKKKLMELYASVTAFKSKLIIKNNNWFVIVRINSDQGTMKVSFDPDLLDRLIGFSPVELNSKENEIAVNPAVKEKMNFMLKRGQQVIKNLKCQMTLVHEEGCEFPVIIAISDDNAFYDPTKCS